MRETSSVRYFIEVLFIYSAIKGIIQQVHQYPLEVKRFIRQVAK